MFVTLSLKNYLTDLAQIQNRDRLYPTFYLENIHGSRDIIEKPKFKRAALQATARYILKNL